ncbi:helix-turn-helix domain-containing protein [Pseudoflavonifractor sp. BIOML-A6]|jgi:hypothetical protein|nr:MULTISPECIES: helix-turn-helix transcriptional regulator [unclassified Pseudoflavonifractor]MTQ97163.1 helix-turn-helix domain-containing protein [Pseudoflavonifractor sp. BIOML-A16]MTR05938.1 helix-turn-helix domain-containing protein [Pseudoflavonifractor sp. BIOML-A15]MTR32569.1 helix-turn-helix domain-containing protein [Pseudoflavonifractor sp. BIOML-A14]MTR72980.1 helix-turn-helix domain-containing protein [Pseudoflavonifractor sp. BIOML-A18]MTS63797.1 helix-turn-helix domain-containi
MDARQRKKYRILGLNVAYYRNLRGLSQEQLAERCGLERTTISKVEQAAVGASLDTIFSISDALDVKPEALFFFREGIKEGK